MHSQADGRRGRTRRIVIYSACGGALCGAIVAGVAGMLLGAGSEWATVRIGAVLGGVCFGVLVALPLAPAVLLPSATSHFLVCAAFPGMIGAWLGTQVGMWAAGFHSAPAAGTTDHSAIVDAYSFEGLLVGGVFGCLIACAQLLARSRLPADAAEAMRG